MDIADFEAARIIVAPAIGHFANRHACGVLQHVTDRRQILVIQTLACHHRNRLRNIFQRLCRLAYGGGIGRVGLRTLSLGIQAAIDTYRGQDTDTRIGLGFNFLSALNNFRDPHMNYQDPLEVFQYCLRHLTRKVTMHHHYERCDVAVFAYR